MSSSFGSIFRVTTFGESHGFAVGVVVDGVPSNIELSDADIQLELDKRKPGQSEITTSRDEDDIAKICSGVFEGKTTGTPIMIMVENRSQRSNDYDDIKNKFRPGHADYTYYKKYGMRDYRGGGRASARESIGRVAGGAIAKKVLAKYSIEVFAHVTQVADIKATTFDRNYINQNPLRTACKMSFQDMYDRIMETKDEGDSIGAIISFYAVNVPVGVGEPIFDKLEARLSYALMSLPAVKGIEFGLGFNAVNYKGSQMNDEITKDGFLTNNAGGILGGISNGDEIYGRVVVKPVSSILIPKRTVDINNKETEIVTKGRHDSCVAPRAVVIIEAMIAITILDMYMLDKAKRI